MGLKRKLVFCSSAVKRDAVRREMLNGEEHIVVSSYTLPDNVVMNGGLYPAEEIANSFETLERTLAPIGHPHDESGAFLPANDPQAIHNFHAGAFNMNVKRENGRVHLEKWINVREAKKSDRGRRLLDRVHELETSKDPRPVHTSTGLFLEVEPIQTPKKNAAGDEYSWIARNMVFDHDAILLDEVGAAQPHQGVGMAVNAAGEQMEVDRYTITDAVNTVRASTSLPLADSGRRWDGAAAVKRVRAVAGAEDAPNSAYARYHLWYDSEDAENFGAYKLPFVDIIDGEPHAIPSALRNAAARLDQTQGPSDAEKTRIRSIIDGYLSKLRGNAEGQSVSEKMQAVYDALERAGIGSPWIAELYDGDVIYSTGDDMYFTVPYSIDPQGRATVTGIPTPVMRIVTWQPQTNRRGDEVMKELILNALKAANVQTDGLTDEQLVAEYSKLQANSGGGTGTGEGNSAELAAVVANALKPISDRLEGLEGKINQKSDEEHSALAKTVANSGKFPGLDEESAKLLPVAKLREMAANVGIAHGVPLTANMGGFGKGASSAPADMPE